MKAAPIFTILLHVGPGTHAAETRRDPGLSGRSNEETSHRTNERATQGPGGQRVPVEAAREAPTGLFTLL